RDNALAVGREGDGGDGSGVTLEALDLLEADQVPQADGEVLAARNQPLVAGAGLESARRQSLLAVSRDGHAPDDVLVAGQLLKLDAAAEVPPAHGHVAAGR